MPLNMKNINNFTQWKKWISRCDVRARNHAPKAPRAVWAQSWRSTPSAVDIFNTLCVFTKEPIRTRNLVGVYEYTPMNKRNDKLTTRMNIKQPWHWSGLVNVGYIKFQWILPGLSVLGKISSRYFWNQGKK